MEANIYYQLIFDDFGKFCEILRHKTHIYAFAKLNISILQGYATVDFSIVLLKIILVSVNSIIQEHECKILFIIWLQNRILFAIFATKCQDSSINKRDHSKKYLVIMTR